MSQHTEIACSRIQTLFMLDTKFDMSQLSYNFYAAYFNMTPEDVDDWRNVGNLGSH